MSSVHTRRVSLNIRKRGKTYHFRFRENEKQREIALGPDLSVAKAIAKQLSARLVSVRTGTADPREHTWAEAERMPLAEHLTDWHAYLLAKGCGQRHAEQSCQQVSRLIDSARIQRISQLSIATVQGALSDLRQTKGRRGRQRMSDNCIAHYARSVKSFSRWLWRAQQVRDDALVHLASPEVNDKYTRQALSAEEAAVLIASTASQPVRSRMPGSDRAMLYAVALGTGLRLSELLSLTPESFSLDSDPPTVYCLGVNTKNGRAALQPIRPELAAMLRPWLAGKAPGRPVFTLRTDAAARVLRQDLEAAGIAQSEAYDFHALRHSYITMVVKSGASVKVCQELARHGDPKLTMNVYSHLTIHDTAKGLDGLAHTLPTPCVSKGLTGTDGAAVVTSPKEPQADPSRLALVTGSQIGPDLAAVLLELADDAANLGATEKRLELADQGGAFCPVKLRGQGGHHVLDEAEGRLARKAGRSEIIECRRQGRS
jgi:site-specific recombinase XerD